jgi:hypothetical protein
MTVYPLITPGIVNILKRYSIYNIIYIRGLVPRPSKYIDNLGRTNSSLL